MVAQLQQGAVPIQARAVPQSTFSPRFRLILDLLVYRSACSVCECVCVCAVQMALPARRHLKCPSCCLCSFSFAMHHMHTPQTLLYSSVVRFML